MWLLKKVGQWRKEDDDGRLTGDQRMDPRGKTRTNIFFTQFSYLFIPYTRRRVPLVRDHPTPNATALFGRHSLVISFTCYSVTMAAEVFAETPSRLLRRVQQLEDMELPSLPSIQHDIDFESSAASSEGMSSEEETQDREDEDWSVSPTSWLSLGMTKLTNLRTLLPLMRPERNPSATNQQICRQLPVLHPHISHHCTMEGL